MADLIPLPRGTYHIRVDRSGVLLFRIPYTICRIRAHLSFTGWKQQCLGQQQRVFLCVFGLSASVYQKERSDPHNHPQPSPPQTLGKPIEPATRTSNFEHVAIRCRLKRHGKSLFFSRFLTVNSAGCGRASGRVRVLR